MITKSEVLDSIIDNLGSLRTSLEAVAESFELTADDEPVSRASVAAILQSYAMTVETIIDKSQWDRISEPAAPELPH